MNEKIHNYQSYPAVRNIGYSNEKLDWQNIPTGATVAQMS